jgi:nitroimidazol reductase NimA-like FMN-containing flavoprotein (pyridoxamine 5'-phosphate oxidase superfamily)
MAWTKAKKLKFLSDAEIIRVATIDRRGRPQVTPVCHVVSAGKVYWASDVDAEKIANIEHHHSVALVADVYKSTWKDIGGVMAEGNAKIVKGGPLFRKIREMLYKKFTVYRSKAPLEEGEAVIIEVTPSRMISWWFM